MSDYARVSVRIDGVTEAYCEFYLPRDWSYQIGMESERLVQEAAVRCLRAAIEKPEKIYIQVKKLEEGK